VYFFTIQKFRNDERFYFSLYKQLIVRFLSRIGLILKDTVAPKVLYKEGFKRNVTVVPFFVTEG
jgi:hypothetical protein